MIVRLINSLWHHIRYIPLLSALSISRGRAFDRRCRALGALVGLVVRYFPIARRRVERELRRIYPDMPRDERLQLCRNMGRNMGRTLFEILHCTEFQTLHHRNIVSGPGLAALESAHEAGKGAIIVSGHFGQWEAIRSALKARGMETGAVYRPQTNRHYERRLLSGIEAGGKPILATGKIGTRALVRHIREGGFIAILLDEKYPDGARLPFLGHPALTSLVAAQLALKYDLPMVPAFGTRIGDGTKFNVEFDAVIPPSDGLTMTQAFNDNLSQRVHADPDQWYWMLRRWKGA
ncbi:MAG: lysophospholipid acyltransferase family protein [Octadecabacter sp.]|nr:lysophospholipid acyltransferase family protein [Octadecabacter sp.]